MVLTQKFEQRFPKPPTDVEGLIKYIKEQGIQIVDLRFVDLLGTVQHFSLPITEVTPGLFRDGSGFDGSSIRGFQVINESDMLVVPDPTTAFVDPILGYPTLVLYCDVRDPSTWKPYPRDPRYIAHKAEEHLKKTGIADISYFGPELEFFIFNSARFDYNDHEGYYFIDSDEASWNFGLDGGKPNLAHRIRHKEGYFPLPPVDSLQDLRSDIILRMMAAGLTIEKHHHEVATAGQCEIGLRYDSLTKQADQVMTYKYIVKNTAHLHGKTATFMPKPLFGDNGTGMHTHQSLWKDGKPIFSDEKGYAGASQLMMWYIGGILKHSPAILAFAAPTTNSYRRLVPGYEAPVNLAYSMRNRSASVRIPMYERSAASKRLEYRCPDPTCNPYLAFSAMLMAGLDGIKNKIDPGKPVDVDIYELSPEEAKHIPTVPGSLEQSLAALEKDHAFLLDGDVFTKDLIETWIDYKRTKEVDPMRLRPHPYEFFLYFDA